MTAWQPWNEDGITRALKKFWLTIATTSFKLYPNNHQTKYRQIMRRKWYACVVVVEPMVIRTGTKRAIILIPNSSKYGLTRCESFSHTLLHWKLRASKKNMKLTQLHYSSIAKEQINFDNFRQFISATHAWMGNLAQAYTNIVLIVLYD